MSWDNASIGARRIQEPQRTSLDQPREGVRQYSFLRLGHQYDGISDVYDEDATHRVQSDWAIMGQVHDRTYLQHVKSLWAKWPQLRLLAEFMEIGTSPLRWPHLRQNPREREERVSRTRVTRLDYTASGEAIEQRIENGGDLRSSIAQTTPMDNTLRLYIVEDLSRDVIEILGSHYQIEPHFFREHIFNYNWYNTQDRCVNFPRLRKLIRKQRWTQLRFARIKYFRNTNSFIRATNEAQSFNVVRGPEDDRNSKNTWDNKDSKIAIIRTRASIWMNNPDSGQDRVGIFLLDPTIKEGFQLWNGYGSWEETPNMNENYVLDRPTHGSLHVQLINHLKNKETIRNAMRDPSSFYEFPLQTLLHLVACEWIVMTEYITTRLEWEAMYPRDFLSLSNLSHLSLDVPMEKCDGLRPV